MSIRFLTGVATSIIGAALPLSALADVPVVATDIAPVHGLVARVMQGVGTPELVVRAGASPHGYAMRPSEARALEQADAVFWVGPALAPWLEDAVATLAPDAITVELLDVPDTLTRSFREEIGAEDAHDDHADEDDHDHDHDHDGEVDPHAWLDPLNGKVWLEAIADTLATLDPDNADAYRANAEEGATEIDEAMEAIAADLAATPTPRFVVFHDAYQYFEARFGLSAAGAISLSDAVEPGPARIEQIRQTVESQGVRCVFSEPQFDQGIVETVLEGTGATSSVIDPLGVEIAPGPGFYVELLEDVGTKIAFCHE